jgi:choline monooxygenase
MADGPPASPARALDPSLYGRADIFGLEREGVFAKAWRLIGHENMLPGAGDFLTDEIAGRPVLAVRGKDGAVRAFHNVCPHRAGPLATAAQGHCDGAITCQYHGWRFTFDGRLQSARDFGAAEGFDPRAHGLTPVRLETWRGFLFVALSEATPPIGDLMTPVDASWTDQSVQPFALRRSHTIRCDWKAYVENYLEGYHVPLIHPGLDAEIDSSKYTVHMEGEIAVHRAPSRKSGNVYSGLWAWAWPWLGINVYEHGVMMERISPVGPEETRLDYLYFFDPARADELADMLALSDAVTAEDKEMCEIVHRNITGGIYRAGPLSPRHEGAVAWFQARLRREAGYPA